MRQVAAFLALSTVLLVGGESASAGTIYDAAADFSITNGNPNGVWSYGYFSPLTTTPLNLYTTPHFSFLGNPDWIAWNNPSAGDGTVPAAFKNTSSTTEQTGTVKLGPGQLAEHPGPNNEVAVVRWTAPASGVYIINVTFSGVDVGGNNPLGTSTGTTTGVHVLNNGASAFNSSVNGFGNPTSFSETLALPVNFQIDFTVDFSGSATDLNYFNDSTGLSAQISTVPEPGSLTLLGLGIAGMAGYRLRRRRSA